MKSNWVFFLLVLLPLATLPVCAKSGELRASDAEATAAEKTDGKQKQATNKWTNAPALNDSHLSKKKDELKPSDHINSENSMRKNASASTNLRVMTFNIWYSGTMVNDGWQKIAKHIALVDPDIVALQEVRSSDVIGDKWKSRYEGDTAILTKHKFVKQQTPSTKHSVGATIELKNNLSSPFIINFFALHLEYRSYGPYAAQNKLVTGIDQIMRGEDSKDSKFGRGYDIKQLLANEDFRRFLSKVDTEPLVVAGDFNCPSHLDWVDETRASHGGWVVEWPATKLLADAGLVDSFRELHPNVTETPGLTWSTVQKASGWEWDYSIDFILYKAASGDDAGGKANYFKPVKSITYAGTKPRKLLSDDDYKNNDWPSDHFAVITEFAWSGKNATIESNKAGGKTSSHFSASNNQAQKGE